MGGVGQSKELCERTSFPDEVFINTNVAELVALLNAINDAYTLSMRGRLPAVDSPEAQKVRKENKDEGKRNVNDSVDSPSVNSFVRTITGEKETSGRDETWSPSTAEGSMFWSTAQGSASSMENFEDTVSERRLNAQKGSRKGSRKGAGGAGWTIGEGGEERKRSDEEDEDSPGKFTDEEIEQLFEPFKRIYLANHYLGDVGIIPGKMSHHALSVMGKNKYLHTLDLSFNYLSANAVLPLMNLLRGMPHFRHLSLGGNAIGHEGCVHVADFLAENPSLEVLSLFHCNLTDEDCLTLLNGLRFNTHLKLLNLDFNFCTWKFVYSLIELVRDHNEALAVVLFESVPHDPLTLKVLPQDTVRKIEYPCTPAGFFRSFQTYYNPDGMSEVEQKAAAERFLLRRLVCRMDFTGLQPFPPALLLELEQYLEPRRDAYVVELDEERQVKLEEDMRHVIGSRRMNEDQLGLENVGEEGWKPTSHKDDGKWSKGEHGKWEGESSALPRLAALGTTADEAAAAAARKPHKPVGQPTAGGGGGGHPSLRHRQRNGFNGCLRRVLPPLNSPQRLQMVLSEAYQFRRKLHRGSHRPLGEKILPNGFDRIWMAPLHEVKTASYNCIVNHKPSYLKACWCDPHDAASPYAGRLHYHCKLEEYIDYSQSSTANAKRKEEMAGKGHSDGGRRRGSLAADHGGARRGQRQDQIPHDRRSSSSRAPRSFSLTPGGNNSKSRGRTHLDENPLAVPRENHSVPHGMHCSPSGENNNSRDSLDSNDVIETGSGGPNRQPYHGCQGTGHRCVSMKVKPGTLGGGAHKMAQAGGPPRDKVVYTNKEGLAMVLHYNPVVYFTSPYQPEAPIVENL